MAREKIFPGSRSGARLRMVDNARAGGVAGGFVSVAFTPSPSPAENPDRQVIRSGTLEIIAADPAQTAEQLRVLAARLSGFVVSSKVSGSDERTQSAQVTLRIPAEHFDEARAAIRATAKAVQQDRPATSLVSMSISRPPCAMPASRNNNTW